VRVVLGTSGFAHPGGSESYVLLMAEQLERLGHDVTVRAVDRGVLSEAAEARGVRVAAPGEEPEAAPDAILTQDAPTAYELAELWPEVPQVFRACSDVFDFQLPPALPGVVAAVLVASERVAARVRATAAPAPIVRLRHPVDVRRFTPMRPLAAEPRRALVLGNYLDGERYDALAAALAAAGIECRRVGYPAPATLAPEVEMNDADIVVGKARVILEAMACGRAAYVYDIGGRDGWVTPALYEAMEADNFAGQATDAPLDPGALAADLAGYDAAMGDANRDLAVRNHHAGRHADQLVALFREVGASAAAAPEAAGELARLGRRQWVAERDAINLRRELGGVLERFAPAREELEALYADRDLVRAEREAWAARAAAAEAELKQLGRGERDVAWWRAMARVRGRA